MAIKSGDKYEKTAINPESGNKKTVKNVLINVPINVPKKIDDNPC